MGPRTGVLAITPTTFMGQRRRCTACYLRQKSEAKPEEELSETMLFEKLLLRGALSKRFCSKSSCCVLQSSELLNLQHSCQSWIPLCGEESREEKPMGTAVNSRSHVCVVVHCGRTQCYHVGLAWGAGVELSACCTFCPLELKSSLP